MRRSPEQNRLLAAMPAHTFERLLPHLELVALPRSIIVCEPGCTLDHAYFIATPLTPTLSPPSGEGEIVIMADRGRDGPGRRSPP